MLSNYRVLDLTDDRGHLAGFIWAQMGADVIAIEPPGGSAARELGPFAGDSADPERSLTHWAYNRGKRSVVLDLETAEGRDALHKLVAGADVLFESCDPGRREELGLTPDVLADLNPALIHASITPFGGDGPKASWRATDLTLQAAAGNMAITGDPDRAPLRAGGPMPQAFNTAAAEAAAAALIAMYERQTRSGLGQHIDVSAQTSMNQATMSNSLAGLLGATVPTRAGAGAILGTIEIQLAWPCKDGYVSAAVLFGPAFVHFTQNLMAWAHEEGVIDEATRDKDWLQYGMLLATGQEPVEEYTRVKKEIGEFFATKTKNELIAGALERRLLLAPVSTVADVLDSEQLAARRFWDEIDTPDGGVARYPGPFAQLSESPIGSPGRPPHVGEHTEEVLAEPARSPAVANPSSGAGRPLEGIKILDFSWVIAGPAATRVLADYGADIIRVESQHKVDAVRTVQPYLNDEVDHDLSGGFNNYNAGKRGLALDISKPGAIDVLWDLIDWADVVLESFSPGSLDRLGIGYGAIHERHPEVIVASSSLWGQSGPLVELAGFGMQAAAVSGHFYPVGWPDRGPVGPYGAYTDYVSPRWLTAAIMGALEHRRVHGVGQYIDMSQAEAAMHLLSPAILDRSVNDRTCERVGNRDLNMAPHGVYPTDGDDAWIAIACEDDAAWAALAAMSGQGDEADLTAADRASRADEIDEVLSAWTAGHDGVALMEQLQANGVAAHIVQNSLELMADPQLAHRNHYLEVEHHKAGTFTVEASRFKMSRTPAVTTHGGPGLGEHTFEILTEVLGYDPDQAGELAAAELLE